MRFSLFLVPHTIHDVLLANLEDIVGQPVKDKAALKIHKKDSHDNRHEEHHPCLSGISRGGSHFLADELSDAHQDWSNIEWILYGKVFYPKDEGAVPEFNGYDQQPEKSPEDWNLDEQR
jgi:hypothetical protein